MRRREFDFHLRRRIVEIHDGELILRAYRAGAVADAARTRSTQAGLIGITAAAHIEAACLHAALAAKQAGRKGDGSPPNHRYAGSSIDDELHWLTHLAMAFARTRTPDPVDQGANR